MIKINILRIIKKCISCLKVFKGNKSNETTNLKNMIETKLPENQIGGELRTVFENIYTNNKWGGEHGAYYSGRGSDDDFAIPYAELVKKFILDNSIKSVVDCGCGDFRVAQKFITDDIDYTGVDIVKGLVDRNNQLFATSNTQFTCKNIVEEQLPDGDLCLVRQVLQHLQNDEIKKALQNMKKYKYVIVTEHIPIDDGSKKILYNLDIPHGRDIRILIDSGVFLEKEPYCIPVKILMEFHQEDVEGVLRTVLIQNRN